MLSKVRVKISKYFSEYLLFLGPGLLLAIETAGESGLTEVVEAGAHFGYALMWVIVLTLCFKFAFANGIARYTLATGETIFDGLRRIPGPRNWGVLVIMFIYFLEMFAFAGMLLLGGIFLDYLLPGINLPVVIGIISVLLIVVFLWKDSYENLEKIIIIMAILLFTGIAFSLLEFPISFDAMAHGLNPEIPENAIIEVMALMGTVGSGLSILLYSVWLHEKIGKNHGQEYFRKHIKSVNLDLGLAFVIIAIVSTIFLSLGVAGFSASYIGHGEYLSTDFIIAQILYVLAYIPNGIPVFLLIGFMIFFGAVMSGMDGRARAISGILTSAFDVKWSEKKLYRIILLAFTLIIFSGFIIGEPTSLIRHVAAAASVMFALLGFVLIYLDTKLPEYARGSRLWVLVMVVGSSLFLLMALFMEQALLTYGLPLIERLALVGIIIFAFSKTGLFNRFLVGKTNLTDRAWLVLIFGAISVYGTYRGIGVDGIIINFRDLGPMVAGLIGGPVVGALAGLIGGAYRYSLGGWTGLSCAAATVIAGIISGLSGQYWKGKITYFRGCLLAFIVVTTHIFIIFPLLTMPSVAQFISVVRAAWLPMVAVNVFGMILFIYILDEKGEDLKDLISDCRLKICSDDREENEGEGRVQKEGEERV